MTDTKHHLTEATDLSDTTAPRTPSQLSQDGDHHTEGYEETIIDFEDAIRLGTEDWKPYYYVGKDRLQTENYMQAVDLFTKADMLNPSDTRILRSLAKAYLKSGCHDQAISSLKQCVDRDSEEDWAVFEDLGLCYWEKQDYIQAISNFSEAYHLRPDRKNIYLFFTELMQSADNRKVISHLRTARVLGFSENFIYIPQAIALANQKLYDDAIYELELAERRNPQNSHIKFAMADILRLQNKRAEALEKYEQAMSLSYDDHNIYRELGRFYLLAGKYNEAIMHLTSAKKLKPTDLATLKLLAQAFVDKGDYAEATIEVLEVQRLDPNDHWCETIFAVLLSEKGEHYEALQKFSEDNHPEKRDASFYLCSGVLWTNAGYPEEASAEFDQIQEHSGCDSKLYLEMGRALMLSGELDPAILKFEEAKLIDGRDWEANLYLGLSLKLKRKEDIGSVEGNRFIQEALNIHCEYAVYCNWGKILLELGKVGESVAKFEKALELYPYYTKARVLKEKAEKKLGRDDGILVQKTESG